MVFFNSPHDVHGFVLAPGLTTYIGWVGSQSRCKLTYDRIGGGEELFSPSQCAMVTCLAHGIKVFLRYGWRGCWGGAPGTEG